jgi:hypothetical protein
MQVRFLSKVIIHQDLAPGQPLDKNERLLQVVRIPSVSDTPNFDLHHKATADVLL